MITIQIALLSSPSLFFPDLNSVRIHIKFYTYKDTKIRPESDRRDASDIFRPASDRKVTM